MNAIDISIGVILAFGLVRGAMKGFVLELTGLLSVFLGAIGAFVYATHVEEWIAPYLTWKANYIQLTAFILTFLIIATLVALIGKALTKFLNFIALGLLNRIVGGVFGLLKMAVIVFIVVLIVSSINSRIGFLDESEVVKNSVTYAFFDDLVKVYLPDMINFAKDNDLLPEDTEN